jgi:hypothetical protein
MRLLCPKCGSKHVRGPRRGDGMIDCPVCNTILGYDLAGNPAYERRLIKEALTEAIPGLVTEPFRLWPYIVWPIASGAVTGLFLYVIYLILCGL